MFCIGLAMTLRKGAYQKYKRAHEHLWPAIAEGMRENGVSMAIYRDGRRLFLFATAPDKRHWLRSRKDPLLPKWDAAMTRFLESSVPGRIAFVALPKAFGFGEFSGASGARPASKKSR
jgi:L-rhamnose mutarotase